MSRYYVSVTNSRRGGPPPKSSNTFDCTACPAYCCSVYTRVSVTPSDVRRLARHFQLPMRVARLRYTRMYGAERILRRARDPVLGEACTFLDKTTRGCSIYAARPSVCREYPGRPRCAYYDVLQFEREQQEDRHVLPLVQISFPEVRKAPGRDE
jgi:uncharacterized protein